MEHSVEFRRTADAITAAAKKKNLDGAALAYVDMTMKCVNCHKYVRGVRISLKVVRTCCISYRFGTITRGGRHDDLWHLGFAPC